MTTRVAPWLDGLSEAWEEPPKTDTTTKISSASHDANSLQKNKSRIPRPNLNGHSSTLSRQHTTSRQSTQKKRNPLATLSRNDSNSVRRHSSTNKFGGSRSVSEASNGSILICGTVQQRSKSASPGKKKDTLEWKRRLVDGQIDYGDQTDLFGPSGLDNIFARSKGPENKIPKVKDTKSWLQRSDAPMPSSPPPWPSCFVDDSKDLIVDAENSGVPPEEVPDDEEGLLEDGGSFRSDPFDLENSVASPVHNRGDSVPPSFLDTSPERALEPTQSDMNQNRTISGQTELEQEDFSPVYVSKHKTVNGQVDYAALDSHLVKQLQSKNMQLRHPSQQNPDETLATSSDQAEPSAVTDDAQNDSTDVVPDLSFSENLLTNSPYPNVGLKIQTKGIGDSRKASVKGGLLTTSPSKMEDSIIPETSELPSPLLSAERLPRAPTPPKTAATPSPPTEPKSKSSGSPLKLFGAHDTFTNNRLLRRMSQLNAEGSIRQQSPYVAPKNGGRSRDVSKGSSFGNGELDDHPFEANITITSASDSDNDDSAGSPGSEIPPPGSRDPLAFKFTVSSEVKDTFKMKRKLSKQSGAASKGSTLENQVKLDSACYKTNNSVSDDQRNIEGASNQDRCYGEGKRPPTSPFKNPTPKRRRTLHATEMEEGVAAINDSYHNAIQEALSSRKRKDALHGEIQNVADPEILAQRRILRPRNPTPSQRRREQIESELREAAEEFAEQEPERLEAVMEQIECSMASDDPPDLEQQAQTLASEVAAFTLRVQKPSADLGERKRSVTTQDFLNEAMMVMNLIRAKARPQSNLGSVEESDAEAIRQSLPGQEEEEQEEEEGNESLLRISRPPSREGSGWRTRAPHQSDARVVSYLRKFEEDRGDVEDSAFIPQSIIDLGVDDEEHVNDRVVVVDKHANVRITGPPIRQPKEKTGTDSNPNSHQSQAGALNTQTSDGTSTGRTIGSVSTHKSDSRGRLNPKAVPQLIDDVARTAPGMTFDKDQRRWVKTSKIPEKGHGSFLELPSTINSEDDPFREISDLPVDEQKELRQLSSGGYRLSTTSMDGKIAPVGESDPMASMQARVETAMSSQETVAVRPVTRDSSHVQPNHSSSVPSRYTAFASSQQQEKIETRATSWSDEEMARMSAFGKARQQPAVYVSTKIASSQRAEGADVVKPSSHGNDSVQPLAPPKQRSMPDLAAVSNAQAAQTDDVGENASKDPHFHDDTTPDTGEANANTVKTRQTPSKSSLPCRPAYASANRQISLRRKTFTNAMEHDIQEESELSILAPLPGDRMMSVSVSVSRPLSTRQQTRKITELQSSPSKCSSPCLLSDLPDFTVHEEDAERPSERALATRLAHHAAREVDDRYAQAVNGLVKILTDVSQNEPFWEDIKRLDLRNRSLGTLHGLDDFCTNVQDMDISSNDLSNLIGAPMTLRRLRATSNQLSSLTAWNHLTNLQYLDISDNGLDNLDSLRTLIHLRELRADDNQITCINGVLELDGLLKLRLRRNKLVRVDFSASQLHGLEMLDLCSNEIVSLEHLESLQSLVQLKIDDNDLAQGLQAADTLSQLHHLSVKSSNLSALNVSWCPELRHLSVDSNNLSTIENITHLKRLDTLSMRHQNLSPDSPLTIFNTPFEASTLHLSGTILPNLHLPHPFLNIRHLELASTGLQTLPPDFGLRMPNLRTLNLNFNSLSDLRPLLNIQRLERLEVCSNRVQRLRKSLAVLGKMEGLREVDLRGNPVTMGFYASFNSTLTSRETSLMRRLRGSVGVEVDGDEDVLAEAAEKAKHVLPPGEWEADTQHRARLDEGTEMRRRVYEVLLAMSCRDVVRVDGLEFARERALKQDDVWRRLFELGVLKKSRGGEVDVLE